MTAMTDRENRANLARLNRALHVVDEELYDIGWPAFETVLLSLGWAKIGESPPPTWETTPAETWPTPEEWETEKIPYPDGRVGSARHAASPTAEARARKRAEEGLARDRLTWPGYGDTRWIWDLSADRDRTVARRHIETRGPHGRRYAVMTMLHFAKIEGDEVVAMLRAAGE